MADLFSEDLTHNFLFSHPKFSPKTITLWKIPSHIDYFEEFQDQKVAYYHSHLLDRTDCPKHHLKNDFRGKTKNQKNSKNKETRNLRRFAEFIAVAIHLFLKKKLGARDSAPVWVPALSLPDGSTNGAEMPLGQSCGWPNRG
jgi:hypothetical protein